MDKNHQWGKVLVFSMLLGLVILARAQLLAISAEDKTTQAPPTLPPTTENAVPPTDFLKQNLELHLSDCVLNAVDMNTGDLSALPTENFRLTCEILGPNRTFCQFKDLSNRPFGEALFFNVIHGQTAVLMTETEADLFIINLNHQKVYSSSTLNMNGQMRGEKICGGSMEFKGQVKKNLIRPTRT